MMGRHFFQLLLSSNLTQRPPVVPSEMGRVDEAEQKSRV